VDESGSGIKRIRPKSLYNMLKVRVPDGIAICGLQPLHLLGTSLHLDGY
jgi:hypothetical protein